MATTLTLSPAAELFVHPESFALEHDGTQEGIELAYEQVGPLAAPVVVIQGGISSDPHVTAGPRDPTPGWWSALAGPGCALDTRRFRLLSLEFLGRREPVTVSSGDQARATALLLDALGIERLHAFVGASYGGMVALKFAELFPERIERVVAISAPDRSRVFATAWRSLQRRVVALGLEHGCANEALAIARGMGMTSYRSAEEFEQRFQPSPLRGVEEPPHRSRFPVEEYLEARGRDFVGRFEPAALARLSLAIDLHRADVTCIRARTTLVAADPDLLVPPQQLAELAPKFAGPARCRSIPSLHGHDAFLKEIGQLAPLLAQALEESR